MVQRMFRAQGEPYPAVQTVPINLYDTGGDLVVVTPMPGVEAENIDVELLGRTLTLRAGMRGPKQTRREYLIHEWTYGPYERTVQLPVDVDGAHANASHDNGVLVLTFPKGGRTRSVHVPLRQVTSSEAVERGHAGHHTTREGLTGDES
jgi:HSP20 family protein